LPNKATDSPTGSSSAFIQGRLATNQCIAAAEVMLKDGHKGTNRSSTIACRPGLQRIFKPAPNEFSFWLNASPHGVELLKAGGTVENLTA
jgi:hypothetical protein